MKYIRTKDGEVFKLKHDGWLFKEIEPKHTEMLVAIGNDRYEMQKIVYNRVIGKSHWKEEVVAEADNLEELCDWIVLKHNGKIRKLYDNYDTAILCEGNDITLYEEIYGAIETEKGLIYVAKMNEKGELELL